MDVNVKNEVLDTLKNELKKIESNDFKVFFFTIDSKGVPSGYLTYIYETAYCLKEMGYNVFMLHQEAEFGGVGNWMGDKYAEIPHLNIEKDKTDISASDVLFIPEFYSNVMSQTRNLPCKRVVIAQNFNHLTMVIPVGVSWKEFGIKDCIVTTNNLKQRIDTCFPYVNSRVVSPLVNDEIFNMGNEPKKLIVNIVSKNETEINNIIKPFFWKYPMYKWVAFRSLNGLSKEDFAKCLKEAAFTVWFDKETEFGYTPIEAMKCGSIVIGKVPENDPEWMYENETFVNNGIWYYNTDDVHMLLAGAIEAFIKDGVSPEIYSEMAKTSKLYTNEQFADNVRNVYVNDIFKTHKESIIKLIENYENN